MSEIHRSFGINLTVMRIIGLYPPETPNFKYKLRAYAMYVMSLIPVALCGVFGFFLKEDSKINDYNSFVNVGMVLYVFKFMPFLKNPEKIRKCVGCLDYFKFSLGVQKTIMETCTYVCRRNSIIFVSGMIMGWLSWCIKPLFWEDSYQLPSNLWLPFEVKDKPIIYTCVYFFLAVGVGYAGIACGVVDPLVWGLACHITSELEILKYNLQNLDDVTFAQIPSERRKNSVYHKIRSCIRHYQAITDFVNKYEESFSQVVFSQLAGSTFVIGLCCLQLTKIPLYDFNSIMMIFYLCFILLQIYLSCYYGTNLFEENATLSTAIYMGQWYNYDKQSKKALCILMERSRHPMTVTVGKIVDLSLETFTTIIKRSYSLVAVLQNFG